jgi:hypothetical protein
MPLQKLPDLLRQSVSAIVQTFVVGLHPGSLDGILNAIRFVAPIGGGLAFDALTACRKVQPVPHVDPPVSAVDVTVKVIAGVAVGVGVGVGVTSGNSVTEKLERSARPALPRLWPKPTSATKTPARQHTNPIRMRRLKNADCEVEFFFISTVFARSRLEVLKA